VAQNWAVGAGVVIAGHFGFAAVVKAREQTAPLWALMLATVWLDIVFIPLFLMGIETTSTAVRSHSGYGGSIIHADFTHSIVGTVVLSVLLGFAAARLWGKRVGTVVGLVSASHWVLDLIVHRADLPILPGNVGHLPTLGLGLWRFPEASIAVEFVLVILGAILYWRSASRVAKQANRGQIWSNITALLIALCGTFVLILDVTAAAG
jgi:membrane-bound metal-dependent hydrolase YbcI (DUF457 family)